VDRGRSLQILLGKVFHKESNCFIREIAAEQLTAEPLSVIGKLLKDADTQKPYDYFAARCLQTKEWLFCLRMRYDKDFDVAILEILYASDKNLARMEKTKDDLNMLFPDSHSTEIVEIRQYADQTRQPHLDANLRDGKISASLST